MVHGWSPTVLPHARDWGSWLHTTGYWFLDRPKDWNPPQKLVDFLDSGAAPVSVGFGSMNDIGSEELTDIALEALKRTGQRGLLLTGWGGISNRDLPDDVLRIDEAPHDWLFPRVSAAVHHGGAGTTAASLRAGAPTITVPFFADQAFWGERVASLNAGPGPIPPRKLNVGALESAIRGAVGDDRIRQAARRVGESIRSEDGVAEAVKVIEHHTLRRSVVG